MTNLRVVKFIFLMIKIKSTHDRRFRKYKELEKEVNILHDSLSCYPETKIVVFLVLAFFQYIGKIA